MPISGVIGFAEGLGGNGGTTATSFDTTGKTVIVLGVSYQNEVAPTVSDNKGNSYTLVQTQTSGLGPGIRLYKCEAPSVGSGHTFTATASGGYVSIGVLAAESAGVADGDNGANTGGATSLATGSVTPTADGDLFVTARTLDSGAAAGLAIDSGFTIQGSVAFSGGNYYGVAIAYEIQSGSGAAENPTWSQTASTRIAAAIVAFLASAAAPAVRVSNLLLMGVS